MNGQREVLIILRMKTKPYTAIEASLRLEFSGRTGPQCLGVLAGAVAAGSQMMASARKEKNGSQKNND